MKLSLVAALAVLPAVLPAQDAPPSYLDRYRQIVAT